MDINLKIDELKNQFIEKNRHRPTILIIGPQKYCDLMNYASATFGFEGNAVTSYDGLEIIRPIGAEENYLRIV